MKSAQPEEKSKSVFTDFDYTRFYHYSAEDLAAVLHPFGEWLKEARPAGYYLHGQALASAPTPRVKVRDGKTGQIRELLNLSSYNYLGVSYRPEVKRAAIEAIEKYGLGASGSPILSGTFDLHIELAEALADYKKTPAAILFPTGYSANVGFISAIMRSGDNIVLDQFAHASIVDGAILSKAKTLFFRHNNPLDLERKLANLSGKKLVIVEGVYSMDGDMCALPEIVEVCKRHGARILIDEAHSMFLFGPNGRGVVEHFGLEKEVDFHLGTFSKTLGGQGGYVCGSQELIDYVSGFGRARFFSCSLAPVLAAGLLAGIRIVEQEPQLRAKLWSNVAYLRRRFTEEGVDIGHSCSQVIPVMINDDVRVFPIGEKLQERGLFLQPVVHPAVTRHKSRLRIFVSASLSEQDLAEAVDTIADVLRQEGVCRR
ncbi:MAG: aminotransferase class I/II-fold pyridoxal phosphate-dependent enzyme [Vicinamibacteria bacterium]|nr:aminotransferase class I/II-fold pyridoxal phosphate-dependent enzyme [Vicinamibacteria bacterium]